MKIQTYMFRKDWLVFKDGVLYEFYNNQNLIDIVDKLPKGTGETFNFINLNELKQNARNKDVEPSEGTLVLDFSDAEMENKELLKDFLSTKYNIVSNENNKMTINYSIDDLAIRAYSKLTHEQYEALKENILREHNLNG